MLVREEEKRHLSKELYTGSMIDTREIVKAQGSREKGMSDSYMRRISGLNEIQIFQIFE